MAEITMDTILIKIAENVLTYLVSIANNKAASSIEYFRREKEISELDEAIHAELESMASDPVVADSVEDYLSKKRHLSRQPNELRLVSGCKYH